MCVCVCERVFECLCVRLLFKPQKRSQRVRRRRCLSRCHRHRRRQCGTGNDDAADKSNNNNSNDDNDGVGLPVRKVGHIFFLPYRRLPKGHTHTTCAHIQRDRGKRTLIARVYESERDSHVRFVSLARGEVKPS